MGIKVNGIGMESELKIQNFSITNVKHINYMNPYRKWGL
jgi:hypothetical protein